MHSWREERSGGLAHARCERRADCRGLALKVRTPGADSAPVEIDLADSRYGASSFWLEQTPDVFVRLEEMYPGDDAAELSGVELRFAEHGQWFCFSVSIAGGLHVLGWLDGADAIDFLRCSLDRIACQPGDDDGAVVAEMCELYPHADPRRPSGVQMICDGRSLSVWIGRCHCLGTIIGPTMIEFLRRAWARATKAPNGPEGGDGGKVVSILEGLNKCGRS